MLIYKHTDMWNNERLIDLKDHMSVNIVGTKRKKNEFCIHLHKYEKKGSQSFSKLFQSFCMTPGKLS